MNKIENLLKLLPRIECMELDKISSPLVYIGAIGFEDRTFAVLDEALKLGKKIDHVIAIEYRPFEDRNKKMKFEKKLKELKVPDANVKWAIYDRFIPEEFLKNLDTLKVIISSLNVIVDISAMSKLLILVLLQGFRDQDVNLTIVYSEADVYHPVKEKFEAEKEKYQKETETLPIFLTSNVYDIVTTSSLSTIAMQGYPLLMVTFPTFNYKELTALVNEIMPQHLILLEGKPHEKHNHWRHMAIRRLNSKVLNEHFANGETITAKERLISTFDYKETIKILEKIYQSNKYAKKIVIAPTGSKYQTLGVFFFKQMHPDVQIIYPVTKKFTDRYTDGYKALWKIAFPSFSKFVSMLDGYRKNGLVELNRAIQVALKK